MRNEIDRELLALEISAIKLTSECGTFQIRIAHFGKFLVELLKLRFTHKLNWFERCKYHLYFTYVVVQVSCELRDLPRLLAAVGSKCAECGDKIFKIDPPCNTRPWDYSLEDNENRNQDRLLYCRQMRQCLTAITRKDNIVRRAAIQWWGYE